MMLGTAQSPVFGVTGKTFWGCIAWVLPDAMPVWGSSPVAGMVQEKRASLGRLVVYLCGRMELA